MLVFFSSLLNFVLATLLPLLGLALTAALLLYALYVRWLDVPLPDVRDIVAAPSSDRARALLESHADRLVRTRKHLDQQIAQCSANNLPYLYLGYWIRESRKMAYKADFRPIEGLLDGVWQELPTEGNAIRTT